MRNTLIFGLSLLAITLLMTGCDRDHHSDSWFHDNHHRDGDSHEMSVGDKGHGGDDEDMSISVKKQD